MGTPMYLPPGPKSETRHRAIAGGRGSFNFSDTSRYGPGGPASEISLGNVFYLIDPGTGGGATIQRRVPGSIYGGGYIHAWVYDEGDGVDDRIPLSQKPFGVVLIRLTRIAP